MELHRLFSDSAVELGEESSLDVLDLLGVTLTLGLAGVAVLEPTLQFPPACRPHLPLPQGGVGSGVSKTATSASEVPSSLARFETASTQNRHLYGLWS